MVAHHELVAGQGIERVFELLRLGDREVPGIHHAVELALQERLARRFGQKAKRLRQHQREGRGQERDRTFRRGSESDIP